LLEIADEFIENVTTNGSKLAKHRQSEQIEVKDLQLHLEKTLHIKVPGYTDLDSPLHMHRRTTQLENHKQRLNLVRRGLYQYQKQVDKQKQQRQQASQNK
jgi:transcription initiation factor TFIID subunit 12